MSQFSFIEILMDIFRHTFLEIYIYIHTKEQARSHSGKENLHEEKLIVDFRTAISLVTQYLWFASGTTSVQDEERVLRFTPHWLTLIWCAIHQIVPAYIHLWVPGSLCQPGTMKQKSRSWFFFSCLEILEIRFKKIQPKTFKVQFSYRGSHISLINYMQSGIQE